MTRSNLILIVLLIGTNAWWCYQAFDYGVTTTYTQNSLDHHKEALDQTLSIIPLVTSESSSRESIIKSLETDFGLSDVFEKEGYVWTGRIGLRFDERGRLLEIRRSWD